MEPRPLTIPTEFALTKRRSMSTGDLREALQAVEEDHHRFHAKPVNPKIFQGPMVIKKKFFFFIDNYVMGLGGNY